MSIPDEKARAWTRPEDYWPSRRPARSGKPARNRRRQTGDRGDPIEGGRPSLTALPYAAVLIGLAFLAIAIMVMAWPGNRTPFRPAPAQPTTVEIGTAPKGWIDDR
jgi:hypothetical protein